MPAVAFRTHEPHHESYTYSIGPPEPGDERDGRPSCLSQSGALDEDKLLDRLFKVHKAPRCDLVDVTD